MTIWALIPWLPDYEFSDDAQVMSFKKGRQRLLSTTKTDDKGYHQMGLFVGGRRHYYRLHKLIAEAHLGLPSEGTEACHWDGDKDHNHLTNLYYGTRTQNILDMVRHGTHRNARKTHCDSGHEFTEENTYITKRGTRECITCRRKHVRECMKRKRAAS